MMGAGFPRVVLLLLLAYHTHGSLDTYKNGFRKITVEEKKFIMDAVRKFKGQGPNEVKGAQPKVNIDCCKLHGEKEAAYCVSQIEEETREWSEKIVTASWRYETNITDYNSNRLTEISNELAEWTKKQVDWARDFKQQMNKSDSVKVTDWDPLLIRKLDFLSVSTVPKDSSTQNTISTTSQNLSSIYAQATITKNGKTYRMEPELTHLMATSRDWAELEWAWQGWRDATGPLMKDTFTRLVTAQNRAAMDNGFSDMGEGWRVQNYEVDNIEPMVDQLFEEVRPLYEQLHAYVRRKLIQAYPDNDIDPRKPIPAHLLGDMWGQQWLNILDLVIPYPDRTSFDVTPALKEQGYDPMKLFKLAEAFFASIGMNNMTGVFWEKSMIERPTDGREVVCHASASDFYSADCSDFRIKMCTEVTMEYLQTIHHEMGHIQYFMNYCPLSVLFRDGANAGFHEAVGDTIALSVMTPEHLRAIGLLKDDATSADADAKREMEINFLMKAALEKVAFLPFGLLIDKWRWAVFRGEATPDNYNAKWWELRKEYQGVAPPVERSENDFDPGAKFHVPASVPYIRYFLSFVGQFQFQEALCDAKGHKEALHSCDIYQSSEAGDLLKRALGLGSSRPWPEVMQIMTGKRSFDSRALKKYFDPLDQWLRQVNAQNNEYIGWI